MKKRKKVVKKDDWYYVVGVKSNIMYLACDQQAFDQITQTKE